jgi:hypothetical protein
VTRTRSRGRPHQPCRTADDPAALLADDLATADPGIRIRATQVVFYGRTGHAAGTGGSHAEWHRQLALCRAVIAAYGGQVSSGYFDEGCRADRPWRRRPQGQALLAALSSPACPVRALVAADPWRLLPRRPPSSGTGILQQLALRRVVLVLADTGISVLTAGEYTLLGRLISGPVGSALVSGPVAWPSARDRQPRDTRPGRAATWQRRCGEPG